MPDEHRDHDHHEQRQRQPRHGEAELPHLHGHQEREREEDGAAERAGQAAPELVVDSRSIAIVAPG